MKDASFGPADRLRLVGTTEGSGAGVAIYSVATDTAKKALTGLSVGDLVKITGEGNRVEQLLVAGGESNNNNWLVVKRGLIELFLELDNNFSTDKLVVDSVDCPENDETCVGEYEVGSSAEIQFGTTFLWYEANQEIYIDDVFVGSGRRYDPIIEKYLTRLSSIYLTGLIHISFDLPIRARKLLIFTEAI